MPCLFLRACYQKQRTRPAFFPLSDSSTQNIPPRRPLFPSPACHRPFHSRLSPTYSSFTSCFSLLKHAAITPHPNPSRFPLRLSLTPPLPPSFQTNWARCSCQPSRAAAAAVCAPSYHALLPPELLPLRLILLMKTLRTAIRQ